MLLAFTLRPILEGDEVEAVVGRRAVAQNREADDGVERPDLGRLSKDGVDLPADGVGPLERSRVRKLDVHEEEALILLRQETGADALTGKHCQREEAGKNRDADYRFADQKPGNSNVPLPHPIEHAV